MRLPSVVALPLHRVRRQHRHGMGQRRRADRAVHARHAHRAANSPACRCALLLDMAGVDYKRARFVLAEGADGSSMTRTIPMELVESGEVLVAYGQNGEMLRPENGYPLRLVVPGVQGVSWVKYLRRIEVGDKPYGTKDETIHYVDLHARAACTASTPASRKCKSVVTTPSGGQVLLDKGFYNITGLAWSGRGKIKKVDVSVDGGRNWRPARLEGAGDVQVPDALQHRLGLGRQAGHRAEPRHRRDRPRAADLPAELRAVRGTRSIYHNNAIQSWLVAGKRRGEAMSSCRSARSPRWRCCAGRRLRRSAQTTPYPGIGRAATAPEVAAWDIDVRPDFKGLPKGSGSVAQGQDVWEAKCASCHGIFGESNEIFTPLVGGTTKDDVKTGRVARLTDPAYPGRTTLMKVSTRLDAVGLHQPRHALERAEVADAPTRSTPSPPTCSTWAACVPDDFTLSRRQHRRRRRRAAQPQRHDHRPRACGRASKGQRKPDVQGSACMKDCAGRAEGRVAAARLRAQRARQPGRAEPPGRRAARRRHDAAAPARRPPRPAARRRAKPRAAARRWPCCSKNGCTACHGVDAKLVGPSFRDIAKQVRRPGRRGRLPGRQDPAPAAAASGARSRCRRRPCPRPMPEPSRSGWPTGRRSERRADASLRYTSACATSVSAVTVRALHNIALFHRSGHANPSRNAGAQRVRGRRAGRRWACCPQRGAGGLVNRPRSTPRPWPT